MKIRPVEAELFSADRRTVLFTVLATKTQTLHPPDKKHSKIL